MKFVALLAFAMLALPVAAASPVDDLLWQAGVEIQYVTDQTLAAYDALMPREEPQEPPPAPEDETSSHEHGHEDAADEHAPDQAPPEYGEPRTFGPASALAPVSKLVPVPVTDVVGPLPRIDVAEIARIVTDAAPLEPAPAPAASPSAAGSADLAPAAIAAAPEAVSEVAPQLVLAGVVATAGAAGASGAASTLWDRLRRMGWLAGLLLYSRISKERLLDHGTRERLLETIRARPGLAVADLAVVSAIPRNTVTYHLRVLERERLVSATRSGRNRLYFAPGQQPQRENADAIATLRHETTFAVAKAIGASPGVDQKGLCGALGLSPSLAHWHADRLVVSGLVEKRREGRFVRYYPGAAFHVVEARAA